MNLMQWVIIVWMSVSKLGKFHIAENRGFKKLKFSKQTNLEKFDVAIVDSSDPIGPANVLYSKKFYQSVFSALLPEGMAIYQSGTSFFQKIGNKEYLSAK